VPEFEPEELKKRLEVSERKRFFLQRKLAQRAVDEDGFGWSMADLMALLLIFFILFYAHSSNRVTASTDKPVEVKIQEKVRTLFFWLEKPTQKKEDAAGPSPAPAEVETRQASQSNESLEELRREVLRSIDGANEDSFSVKWDNRRLVFVLGERITFNAGEADLLPGSFPTLLKIASIIGSKKGFEVVVSGHTDDRPINTTRFPSNWELSAARAVTVAKFLVDNGLAPNRVSIQGFSSYRPINENTSPENRQANRRVEITLIKENEDGTG
jgi:chemotaxis protein MotB